MHETVQHNMHILQGIKKIVELQIHKCVQFDDAETRSYRFWFD